MVQIQIKPEKYGTADLIIDMCVYFNLRPDELYCLCHNSRPLAAGSPETVEALKSLAQGIALFMIQVPPDDPYLVN